MSLDPKQNNKNVSKPSTSRLKLPRFGTRTLLVATTLVAVAAAYLTECSHSRHEFDNLQAALNKDFPGFVIQDLNHIETSETNESFFSRLTSPKYSTVLMTSYKAKDSDLEDLPIKLMETVEWLQIDGEGITDESFKSINKFKELNNLAIRGSQITGKGFQNFEQSPFKDSLTGLILEGNYSIQSESLANLRVFDDLKQLKIFDCHMSSPYLEYLSELNSLEFVNIAYSKVLTQQSSDLSISQDNINSLSPLLLSLIHI